MNAGNKPPFKPLYYAAVIVMVLFWIRQNQEIQILKQDISRLDAQRNQEAMTEQTNELDAQIINGILEKFEETGAWRKLRCTPSARLDCDRTDCKENNPLVYLIVDRENGMIARCHTKGCDQYEAILQTSGLFTNVQTKEPRGLMVKIEGSNNYIEMATIGLVTILQSGNCTEIE